MNRNELRELAAELGVPARGNNAELAEAIRQAQMARNRVRSGMVVRAKGDKVEVFRTAAEEAGFKVGVKKNRQTGGTFAYAVKGDVRVTAAWAKSGAWDREHTRQTTTGTKGRKIRNLSEALRALV